jgi:hypothetical protein
MVVATWASVLCLRTVSVARVKIKNLQIRKLALYSSNILTLIQAIYTFKTQSL